MGQSWPRAPGAARRRPVCRRTSPQVAFLRGQFLLSQFFFRPRAFPQQISSTRILVSGIASEEVNPRQCNSIKLEAFLNTIPAIPFLLPFLYANQYSNFFILSIFLIKLFPQTEKAMAPHSSILAWKIPWKEEPGGLQSMGS